MKRIRQYRDLLPGDVFTLKGDRRKYMRVRDAFAVHFDEPHKDAILSPFDTCLYHFSVDTRNNIYKRQA